MAAPPPPNRPTVRDASRVALLPLHQAKRSPGDLVCDKPPKRNPRQVAWFMTAPQAKCSLGGLGFRQARGETLAWRPGWRQDPKRNARLAAWFVTRPPSGTLAGALVCDAPQAKPSPGDLVRDKPQAKHQPGGLLCDRPQAKCSPGGMVFDKPQGETLAWRPGAQRAPST